MHNAAERKKEILDLLEKIIKKNGIRTEKNMNNVGKSIVKEWYADYSPRKYRRKHGLLKAFKAEFNDSSYGFHIYFGPDYMPGYRGGAETVYVNSFEKGWHGGAYKGPDHPNPGVPYWRWPSPGRFTSPPYYYEWYMPAARSFSPLEKIEEEFKNCFKEGKQDLWDDYERRVKPKIKALVDYIQKYYMDEGGEW